MDKHVWATPRAAEIAEDMLGNDELQHWGIKGMRWGVRRYQNRDGTLTNAGKRRYNRELEKIKEQERVLKNKQATKAKIDKLNARAAKLKEDQDAMDPDVAARKQKAEAKSAKKAAKAEAKAEEAARKKALADMSDDELSAAIKRMQLEKQYAELTSSSKVQAKGENFVKDALKTAGKTLATDFAIKWGKELLGLNPKKDTDPTAALKKAVEKLNLEKQYKDLTSPKKDYSIDYEKVAKNLNSMSNEELKSIVTRSGSEKAIKKLAEEQAEKRKKKEE